MQKRSRAEANGGILFRSREAERKVRLKRLSGPGSVIGDSKNLAIALKEAEEAASAFAYEPGNGKPEHVVQAGLIHHALMHEMRLNDRLKDFSSYFDELLFVTDELKIPFVTAELKKREIRGDIIALGGKNGKYFPVFIELKATRSFKRVLEQLIETHVEVAKVESVFKEMLSAAIGKEAASISFDQYKLLVVWPEAPSGKGRASAAKAVACPRFESAKGHLLLGEFNKRDGFDAVVRFVESA